MNNAPDFLRSLIIFAVIVPLAVFIGYLLTNPLDYSTFAYVGILTAILLFPMLLRWHHPLLVFSWNSGMMVFFMPGSPNLWLLMTFVSLGITLLQRALGGVKQLISVPQVTWALVCMVGAVVLTARLTGMGLHALGDEVSGGRRYIYLLGAIMGYFALSSRRIPVEKAGLYVGLFFLPGLMASIGDLYGVVPGPFRYIYLLFPGYQVAMADNPLEEGTRLVGGMMVATNMFYFMQARYGIRGIFLSGKSWRWMILVISFVYGMFGGFRNILMLIAMMFFMQFFIEGLHRTKLLFIFALMGLLGSVALVPLAPHLPHTIQRSLAFLPLNIDAAVRRQADTSADWRFDMWKALLPQIPQHLLVGKGYAISRRDLDTLTGQNVSIGSTFAENQYSALAGSYHSGPLSVILTFGIWGVITMIWFWIVALWVLHSNYRYGDPVLRNVNILLLVAFVARVILFLFIFGDMGSDMLYFGGWLGLSVALNGGVCQPARAPARAANRYQAFDGVRAHLQPGFRRPQIGA